MELNNLCIIVPTDFDDDEENKTATKKITKKRFGHSDNNRGCGAPIVGFLKSSLSEFCGHNKHRHRRHRRKHRLSPPVSLTSFHDTEGTGLAEKEVTGSENPRIFSYSELYVGSNGFSEKELLGSGGFGRVYKAVLPSDGTAVAVKCVAEDGERFEKSFAAELLAVAHLRHRNLVRLRGWCVDDGRLLLVYDYMPNRSLDRALFRRNSTATTTMGWRRRRKIVEGLAAALHYLHDNLETQIVHRDVKASNVMLDSGYNARLGDFGLARWLEHSPPPTSTTESSSVSSSDAGNSTFRLSDTSRVGGTIGYLPPESFRRRGSMGTAKSDVFSFGIVALEVAAGRRAVELAMPDDEIVLLDWVRGLSDEGVSVRAKDPRMIGDDFEVERLIHVALLCTLHSPHARPNMRWVAEALSGDGTNKLPPLPSFQSHPKYIAISSPTTRNTTSSLSSTMFAKTSSTVFVTAEDDTIYATTDDGDHAPVRSGSSVRRRFFATIQTAREISYEEISAATDGFSDSRRVAELDFGTAYRGVLDNGEGPEVLVKRLGMKTCPALRVRFTAELQNLGRLRHRNLVQLRGWCTERGEMLVIYDFSPSRVLTRAIPSLKWAARYEVIKSLALAIRYLHEEWEEQVIHRSITSSAVVLDPDATNPRLGSFALAEFLIRNEHGNPHIDRSKPKSARGIFGHMAPEYVASGGEATAAADVYGFGVVVLEIATGQAAVDFRRPDALLAGRVRRLLALRRPVVDPQLDGEFDPKELERLVRLGVECTASDPKSRPTMAEIVRILDGNDAWFAEKGVKKRESLEQWKQLNASSLSLVKRIQALGIQ